jgi:hypothetical protein
MSENDPQTATRRADIGLYTSEVTLAHKLELATDKKNTEATWNMKGLPQRLGKGTEPDRLYFATSGHWRGYFILSTDILWNPEDDERPYTLIFDAASWRDIAPIPVRKFRGFRYLENMPD